MRRLPSASTSLTSPRRELRSPTTAPRYSSGTRTSIFMIGSSRVTLLSEAWRKASSPAEWKASSLESTSWYLPSCSVARTLTKGKPSLPPPEKPSSRPSRTAGMYSRGTVPPLTASTNSKPPPSVGTGSSRTWTTAYWPRPPLWRMKRASVSSARVRRCL